MKKIVLNISDWTYEKLRFESIEEKKNIQELIRERLFLRPFSSEVEQAFGTWYEKELNKIIKE